MSRQAWLLLGLAAVVLLSRKSAAAPTSTPPKESSTESNLVTKDGDLVNAANAAKRGLGIVADIVEQFGDALDGDDDGYSDFELTPGNIDNIDTTETENPDEVDY